MEIQEHDKNNIEAFFNAIEPLKKAFKNISFSYLAVRHEGTFCLVQGGLFLHVGKPSLPFSNFCTDNIRAGHCSLAELKLELHEFIESLLSGSLKLQNVEVQFPGDHSGARSTYYAPFWPAALQNQNRMNVLVLSGAHQATFVRQPMLDWELRASRTPYDSLQELAFEYQLGALQNNAINVHIMAFNVAIIDASSKAEGEKANIVLRLAHGLRKDKATIGCRVLSQGRTVGRQFIKGRELKWERTPECNMGSIEIDIPHAAAVQCIASYDGIAQNSGWVVDPSTVQNARRTALQTYDRQLAKLKEILGRDNARGTDARDFEAAIAWVLWMLGYSVAHLSAKRTSDGPDIIATSPSGNFAVIECTTGLLKADNKLPNLYERAQAMRRELDLSGSNHLRILPIMVTTKKRDDIAAELEQAERHGILVFTHEDIEGALNRTLIFPNADQLYAEAEQSVRRALEKYNAQGGLPLTS